MTPPVRGVPAAQFSALRTRPLPSKGGTEAPKSNIPSHLMLPGVVGFTLLSERDLPAADDHTVGVKFPAGHLVTPLARGSSVINRTATARIAVLPALMLFGFALVPVAFGDKGGASNGGNGGSGGNNVTTTSSTTT